MVPLLQGGHGGVVRHHARMVGLSLLVAVTLAGIASSAGGSTTAEPNRTLQARTPDGIPVHRTARRPAALPVAQAAASHVSMSEEEALVWQSPRHCERVVKNGGRMARHTPDILRIGTWNIRWFPAGRQSGQRNRLNTPTDLRWLTCTLVWMQLDILVVQESLATVRASDAWTQVMQALEHQTGHSWKWSAQHCGRRDRHHVGMLWNTSRATLSDIQSLWPLNTQARTSYAPCKGGRRPGHYAHVQSQRPAGADFHLIGLHLKSGATPAAFKERQRALGRLGVAIAPFLDIDRDVVILGDMNTMGTGDVHSQQAELRDMRCVVAEEAPGFRDLPLTPQCSQYFRGRGSWLDHVLVAQDMAEAGARSVRVTGYCAVAGCRRIHDKYPLAYQRLSDHCPVILDIQDHDWDPHS